MSPRIVLVFLVFLAVFCFAIMPAHAQSESKPDADPLIDRWESWSRDRLKEWQDSKVLHGNDLDRAKRLASSIAVAWKRCLRAERVEDLLDEARRQQYTRLIAAVFDGSKKRTKSELEQLKKTIQGLLATINTAKNLFVSIGRDFEALHILMSSRLLEAKTLEPKIRSRFQVHVLQVKAEHAGFVAFDLWDEGIEEEGQKAILKIEQMLEDLKKA